MVVTHPLKTAVKPWAIRVVKRLRRRVCFWSLRRFDDNSGLMLACASPQAGNHHDLFEIEKLFEDLCVLLKSVSINLKDLFLDADSGRSAAAV